MKKIIYRFPNPEVKLNKKAHYVKIVNNGGHEVIILTKIRTSQVETLLLHYLKLGHYNQDMFVMYLRQADSDTKEIKIKKQINIII